MGGGPLFGGLIVDDQDRPVDTTNIGQEGFYVLDDNGFRRHIESEAVDRQVLDILQEFMLAHREMISQGTMKMIGQEDIFTKAAIDSSLDHLQPQFEALLEHGLPENVRAWLGMLGFRVVIDVHGQVQRVDQPGMVDDSSE